MDGQVEQGDKLIEQLRERGLANPAVLEAMRKVPRGEFVDPGFASSAWCDTALPIACGQTISQPYVVSYMTDKLAPEPHHDVLEIGTGSAYQAAVLAQLARHVYTIERHEELYEQARRRLEKLGIGNVTVRLGDGSKGWPERRQFDRIIVTAAAREMPQALIEQLRLGGRMILPLNRRFRGQRLVLVDKDEAGASVTELLPVRFVPLVPDE